MTSYQLYLSKEDLALFEEFKKIAARESKDMSKILKEMIAEYVKAHGQGNPTFQIDKWVQDPGFLAYPALDSDWEQANLPGFDDKDLTHMAQKAYEILNFIKQEAKKRGFVV